MSIYEAIGGTQAVGRVVKDFYLRVLDDDDLAPYFKHVDMERLFEHQGMFMTAALGRPHGYRNFDMRKAHEGLGITREHFDRVVDYLIKAFSDAGMSLTAIEQVVANLAPLKDEIVESRHL
jgi:hemoglobin